MGIKDKRVSIKQARKLAGLTQEQLSEGICTPLSLSRIENGRAGMRPETFQLLMQRTGCNCQIAPAFKSREAFGEYMALEAAFFAISAGNPQKAWQELERLSTSNERKENPYFYQRFQLAQVYIQLLGNSCNYDRLAIILAELLKMTHPGFYMEKFPDALLSVIDIRLLLALCEIFLHTGQEKLCLNYCDSMKSYLLRDSISFVDKTYFYACTAIYRFNALLASGGDVRGCYEEMDRLWHTCVNSHVPDILPQIYFHVGLCLFTLGNTEKAVHIFRVCYFSARAANHIFSSILHERLKSRYDLEILSEEEQADLLPTPDLPWFDIPPCTAPLQNAPGTEYTYRLGNIIHDLREEKGITLTKLCNGLCSKSTLSKIEGNALFPGKFLCDALLERLGINGDLFYVYCNAEEFRIYELQRKCIYNSSLHTVEGVLRAQQFLEELKAFPQEKEPLLRQFCFSAQTALMPDREKYSGEYRQMVLQGLRSTIPDFEESQPLLFPLAQEERLLLNKLGVNYFFGGQRVRAIRHLYKVLDYYSYNNMIPQEKERSFPVTLSILCHYLYLEKRFNEILALQPEFMDPATQRRYWYLDKIYLYYSQALGELGRMAEAEKYAKYACSLFALNDQIKISEEFSVAFCDDFGIRLFI